MLSMKECFPFTEFRDYQEEIIEFIEKSFKDGKRFVIIEAPPGIGKSPIAIATARYFSQGDGGASFILTTQKILQNQYMKDFGADEKKTNERKQDKLYCIKGRNNYKCVDEGNNKLSSGCTCDEAYCYTREDLDNDIRLLQEYVDGELEDKRKLKNAIHNVFYQNFSRLGIELDILDTKDDFLTEENIELMLSNLELMPKCTYKKNKKTAILQKNILLNFDYFLYETNFAHELTPRKCLIVDECHNIEKKIMEFVQVEITESKANQIGIYFPKEIEEFYEKMQKIEEMRKRTNSYTLGQEKEQKEITDNIIRVVFQKFQETINKNLELMQARRKHLDNKDDLYSLIELKKQEKINAVMQEKIKTITEKYEANEENWILEIQKTCDKKYTIILKPLLIKDYTSEYLFSYGEKILMMSGTILSKDVFCENLGMDIKEVAFKEVSSPFPVHNRPINIMPIGSMSKKNFEINKKNLILGIKEIMEHHKGEKGIIHTVSNSISNYIKENIESERLLFHDNKNKDFTLQTHFISDKDTILVSPSSHEGLSLDDNLSRFQIWCKIPFLNLGDKQIWLKCKRFPEWYNMQTVMILIQGCGRSIRNKNDYAYTYILDSDWEMLYKKNKNKFFPKWFRDSVEQ